MRPASRNCRRERGHLLAVADLARGRGRAGRAGWLPLSGFSMYQKAPASMAATARSSLPLPVMMMAGTEASSSPRRLEKRQTIHAGKLDVGDQNGGTVFGETSQGVFGAGNAENVESPLAAAGLRSRGGHSLRLQR